MIDKILLWIFVWISKRWFDAAVFGVDKDTETTLSISFFVDSKSAKEFLEAIKVTKGDKTK
ncbi:MAG TPA: hypothetical protein VMW91_00860 [Desulfosporosinus sp.]|jgi:hypothetical protein|nr:hypothetical protein [Desulfosporosinus sp.]